MNEENERQRREAEVARWREQATPEMRENYDKAKDFFESKGVEPEKVHSLAVGYDLRKPVEVDTLKPGDVLQRYEHPNAKKNLDPGKRDDNGKIEAGTFLTEVGTPLEKLGVVDVGLDKPSPEKREAALAAEQLGIEEWGAKKFQPERPADFFVVQREVEVLKGTAADFSEPGEKFNQSGSLLGGGGPQYFVGKDDLSALERVVHPDHALEKTTTREDTPADQKGEEPAPDRSEFADMWATIEQRNAERAEQNQNETQQLEQEQRQRR
jgi:hypothetical protein